VEAGERVESSVPTSAVQVIPILLLAAFVLLLLLRDRKPAPANRYPALLGGPAIVALLPHVGFLARERFNINEFYHYYVGTKYFPEVGWSGASETERGRGGHGENR
jgi:hypothetical protein